MAAVAGKPLPPTVKDTQATGRTEPRVAAPSGGEQRPREVSNTRCWNCKGLGHDRQECRQPKQPRQSQAIAKAVEAALAHRLSEGKGKK